MYEYDLVYINVHYQHCGYRLIITLNPGYKSMSGDIPDTILFAIMCLMVLLAKEA